MRAVAVLAVLPEYRRFFVDRLTESFSGSDDTVTLMAGDVHLDSTVKSSEFAGVVAVRNRHLVGRRLLWQSGVIRRAGRADVVVVDLNPRSLTAWALLLQAKLRRQRILAWGHILPRAGADASTVPVRRRMRRMADGVISYTWSDAERVRLEDPNAQVWVAANGLYRSSAMGWAEDTERNRVLYVGRLEPSKKPLLLLEGFAIAAPDLPKTARLTFVGSGSLSQAIEERARELGIEQRVDLLGHISEFDNLQGIYATTKVSVSAGYVGLGLTQSLGFGVPMLVADDEPHAPEVELLTDSTGQFFAADDAGALAGTLAKVFSDELQWDSRQLVESVRLTYSADAMADGFERALRNVPQQRVTYE